MKRYTEVEFEHWCAYLPYGIKAINNKSGRIITLIGAYENEGIIYLIDDTGKHWGEMLWFFKPILRPLSDFYKFKDKKHGDIYEMTFNTAKLSIDVDLDIIINDSELEQEGYVNLMVANETLQVLFKHHFDVFGLIDAGLAIDINTLNK
jgi:hypothetical protein